MPRIIDYLESAAADNTGTSQMDRLLAEDEISNMHTEGSLWADEPYDPARSIAEGDFMPIGWTRGAKGLFVKEPISKERIVKAIKNSRSMAEAAKSINKSYTYFKKHAKKYDLWEPEKLKHKHLKPGPKAKPQPWEREKKIDINKAKKTLSDREKILSDREKNLTKYLKYMEDKSKGYVESLSESPKKPKAIGDKIRHGGSKKTLSDRDMGSILPQRYGRQTGGEVRQSPYDFLETAQPDETAHTNMDRLIAEYGQSQEPQYSMREFQEPYDPAREIAEGSFMPVAGALGMVKGGKGPIGKQAAHFKNILDDVLSKKMIRAWDKPASKEVTEAQYIKHLLKQYGVHGERTL